MNKQKVFTLLYVILIVGIILFMLFIVFWLKSESVSCLQDPIQYLSEKTSQLCYCNDGLGSK